MNGLRGAWIPGVFAVLLGTASAQERGTEELFEPVDAETAEKLASATNFDLRKQLYFARRYKIVRVNFHALERDRQEISVAPFDDLKIVMRAENASAETYGTNRLWRGRIIDPVPPSLSVSASSDEGRLTHAETLLTVNLWISDDAIPAPEDVIDARKSGEPTVPTIGSGPPGSRDAFGNPSETTMAIKTVIGRWPMPSLGTYVTLSPIRDDPPYHLFIVVDPTKVVQGKDHEERKRRWHEYERELDEERKKLGGSAGTEPAQPQN